MKTATIVYAKSHLSALLAEVEADAAGAGVVITRRGNACGASRPAAASGGGEGLTGLNCTFGCPLPPWRV